VTKERDRIVAFLRERGATPAELEGDDIELFEAAMDVLYRPDRPSLTLSGFAARVGADPDDVARLWRALGLAVPAPDDAAFGEADVRLVARMRDVGDLFGDEARLALARVAGASMARLADAGTSSFVTSQALPLVDGLIPFEAVEINALVADSLPAFMDALDTLFRRHLMVVRRTVESVQVHGAETQDLVVAFADLVDSTALAGSMALTELSSAIDHFEATATDIVVGHGGRVIKFIGDEVMFVHADAAGAVAVARDLLTAQGVPPMRIGIDAGPVLSREGDFFGPVVNVAARATSLAAAGSILTTDAVVARLGDRFEPLSRGAIDVRGHGSVAFWELGAGR